MIVEDLLLIALKAHCIALTVNTFFGYIERQLLNRELTLAQREDEV